MRSRFVFLVAEPYERTFYSSKSSSSSLLCKGLSCAKINYYWDYCRGGFRLGVISMLSRILRFYKSRGDSSLYGNKAGGPSLLTELAHWAGIGLLKSKFKLLVEDVN